MIEKSVPLRCGPERAFEIFTARISEWWPATHRRSKSMESRLYLLESGRFYEVAPDGSEFEMGRVREWDAPRRLVLDFYLGTSPEAPTEVTITFAPEGAETRVRVEHRPGQAGDELWTSRAPIFVRSWDAVLPAFSALD